MELTLFSRRGCHLCEEMLDQLHDIGIEKRVSLKVVYIDDDPQLEHQYGTLVPVLSAGEREICHYTLDIHALDICLNEILI